MIPINALNTKVTVRRRNSTGRDSLNNPVYGTPTSGSGWITVYRDMNVRLAFTGKDIKFAAEGERIQPSGTVYYNSGYDLKNEDRIITEDGIEYTVVGINIGYSVGNIIDHYEAKVALP